MKNIVVPIDFSEDSLDGLRLAIIFANTFKSRVQMVNVQKPLPESARSTFEVDHQKIVDSFRTIVSEFSPTLHDPSMLEYIVKKGKVYLEVINQAKAFDGSIIICSTHGASGFEELFIGSNAFKIISASDTPVVTIRHGSIPHAIRTIVMHVDNTSDTRQKVPITTEIAKAFNAEVHVLGVPTMNSEDATRKVAAYSKQVCEYLNDYNVSNKYELLTGSNMASTIVDYSKRVNADLISIMTEQSYNFTDFVLGATLQQMLNKSPIPVLSITPKDIFIKGSVSPSGG